MYRTRLASLLALVCCILTLPVYAANTPNQRWVATWTSAQQTSDTGTGVSKTGFNNQTIRMVIHTSLGGSMVRVHLSNAFGTTSLKVGSVHIALHSQQGAIVPGSDHTVLFHGNPSVTIPPGAPMVSDPVLMDVPQLGELAVSIYLPGSTGAPTWHDLGLQTTYISGPGDFTSSTAIPNTQTEATTRDSWFFLSAVDVQAPRAAFSIVAFGDSITDGAHSTPNENQRWPDLLAARILTASGHKSIAVVNEGISGNRILHDNAGPNALARIDRDVLAVDGVRVLIVLEGINDIGWPDEPDSKYVSQTVTADEIIGGLQQIIHRAHSHGIRVIGATLTPYEGAEYVAAAGEKKREAVNTWIRTSGAFDGVVDFDAATEDPQNPNHFFPAYDSGDHLHPNDAGYKAMANAFDLKMLTRLAEK
ncbi:MAG TPA: SGNH/GDSL hydrolase family protein [Acidobacteriaceae bacterium]|jgi:lysophospholipase L1-like esterase|nr:SGNH/GDSL hydrolase family protein [Acidobacteriaceae bacterium]